MKAIPKGNKGMGKLPKKVRNKMGYMALGGVTGMSGGMDENKKNSATGMTTMRYGGAVAGKKARTGHMDMRKNGMMYGGMVNKKK